MRALVVMLLLLNACSAPAPPPAFMFGANTPDDLRAVAAGTLDAVAEAFPAQLDCLDAIELEGAWELDDRARYDPERSAITLRIPATAPQLEISIVHEAAHHLEFACPGQVDVREPFIEAQGLPADMDWFDGETWTATPSEHWASAVVMHVLSRPDERAGIAVTDDALEVIRAWATDPG